MTDQRNMGQEEAQAENNLSRKQGGWITFPFILANVFGLSVALTGTGGNSIVYLIKEYNMKSIDAAQIINIVNGCISFAPVLGAIVSDAYFGCFPVVVASTVISFMATVLLTLTAAVHSLRPARCAFDSDECEPASARQMSVLYVAVALTAVGTGGTRFNLLAMGASQFDRVRDQSVFFNWYFIVFYTGAIVGMTVIIFMEDSVSWTLGFALCAAANAASAAVLILGMKYYHRLKAHGSPFTSLTRVIVAAAAKWNVVVTHDSPNYYYGLAGSKKPSRSGPSQSLRFLNRAALICDGDTNLADNSIAKPWRLCTVQQVEDLKTITRIVPLFSSSIFLSVSISIQLSLTVLEALTMDRSVGPHFSIPAATIGLISSFGTSILVLSILDRLLLPLWRRFTRHTPTPLQRIGLGHAVNVAAVAASALVEARRASIVRAHNMADRPNWVVPMKVEWLVFPMALTGMGEALHYPGLVALYCQEFPLSLRSTATGMIAVSIALGFYLSTAVVDLVRRTTEWLPNNINASRMDRVYWLVAGLAAVNFGYYLLCAGLYKYQNPPEDVDANVTYEQGPRQLN